MTSDFHPMQHQGGNSPDPFSRLLTTAEASRATGISQYELRKGGEEGRYPVILLGSPANKFRKKRWNLQMLMEAIMNQAKEEQK